MKKTQLNYTRSEKLANFLKKLEKVKKSYQANWDLKGFKRLGQRIIEYYAGWKEDIEVVEAILPHLETVFPIKQRDKMYYYFPEENSGKKLYQCSVITENPEIFRMLIKNEKIDISPKTMYLFDGNKKIISTLQQNLLEILVLLKKYDFVKIMLENINLEEWMRQDEKNGLRTYAISITEREPILTNFDNQVHDLLAAGPFCDNCIFNKKKKPLLKLAFLTEDAKMCDLLIEHNVSNVKETFEESFSLMPVEFVRYFLQKNKEYEKFLHLILILEHENFQLFPIYIERFGLQTMIKSFLEYIKKYKKQQLCTLIIHNGSLFYEIREMKEYCKDQKAKTQMEEAENEFFQYIDSQIDNWTAFLNDNTLPYYIEYKIKQDCPIPENICHHLSEVYLLDTWEEELESNRKKGFYDKKQLNRKTQELFNYKKNVLFLIEEELVSCVKIEKFQELLNVLNSNLYDNIDRIEVRDNFYALHKKLSFLAAVLYKDSVSLVRQAWQNNFLHPENLDDAIQFASEHKKEKSLSVLLEYRGTEDVPC